MPRARRHWRLRSLGVTPVLLALTAAAAAGDDTPPLTSTVGDPVRGEVLVRNMSRVSCLICHKISKLDEKDQGEVGPALDGVAERFSEGELRTRVMDARHIDPETMMPPYFSVEGLANVAEAYRGQTIYAAQEVEDVVAFLLTLTGDQNE